MKMEDIVYGAVYGVVFSMTLIGTIATVSLATQRMPIDCNTQHLNLQFGAKP